MKTLHCSHVDFDCAAVVVAEAVEEVLAQAAAHTQKVHGVAVTAEIAKKIEG